MAAHLGYRYNTFSGKSFGGVVEGNPEGSILDTLIANSLKKRSFTIIGRFIRRSITARDAFVNEEVWYIVYNGQLYQFGTRLLAFAPESITHRILIITDRVAAYQKYLAGEDSLV